MIQSPRMNTKYMELMAQYITVISQFIYLILDPDGKVKSKTKYPFPYEPYGWSKMLERAMRAFRPLSTSPVIRTGCGITMARTVFGTVTAPPLMWNQQLGILSEEIPFTANSSHPHTLASFMYDSKKNPHNRRVLDIALREVDDHRYQVQYIAIGIPEHQMALYLSSDRTHWIAIDSAWNESAPGLREEVWEPRYGLPERGVKNLSEFGQQFGEKIEYVMVVMPSETLMTIIRTVIGETLTGSD